MKYFCFTLTFAIAAACWLRSTPWPLLPDVVVGGAPETEIGGTLLEAAIGEDVEVADEAVSEEGKGNIDEDNVVGSDVDEPLWACISN